MNRLANRLLAGLCLSVALLLSNQVQAQYPGGMGGSGMGGGRMGGGQGMMGNSNAGPRSQMPSSGEMASRQTDWMKVNLALTKEQIKDVKKLNNTYASKQQDEIRALLPTEGPPSDATRQQIREVTMMINEEKEEKLKPLLTPEQWTLYQTKRDSLSKVVGGGRMQGSGKAN